MRRFASCGKKRAFAALSCKIWASGIPDGVTSYGRFICVARQIHCQMSGHIIAQMVAGICSNSSGNRFKSRHPKDGTQCIWPRWTMLAARSRRAPLAVRLEFCSWARVSERRLPEIAMNGRTE